MLTQEVSAPNAAKANVGRAVATPSMVGERPTPTLTSSSRAEAGHRHPEVAGHQQDGHQDQHTTGGDTGRATVAAEPATGVIGGARR